MNNRMTNRTNVEKSSVSDRSVVRAGKILQCFVSEENQELGISELANLTELSLSTVHRIVQSLVEMDMLQQSQTNGKYSLGGMAVTLGRRALHLRGLDIQAYPALFSLVHATGEGANLGGLVQGKIVYIQRVFGTHPLRTDFPVGTDAPAHCSAIGKAILTFSDEKVIEFCLQTDFSAPTRYTISDRNSLLNELNITRERGYSLDQEELIEGITCIGAPIFFEGHVVAAVAIQAPTVRMTADKIKTYAPQVIQTAKDITNWIK